MRARSSGRKCMRPGPVTNNGYLNFLREYRKKCCGLSAVETVVRGAEQWNQLSQAEKDKYRDKATRRNGRGKCMRPGPVTNNGYLNFLREYRRKHCGLTAVQTVRQGAKAWNSLSEQEKNKYTAIVSIVPHANDTIYSNLLNPLFHCHRVVISQADLVAVDWENVYECQEVEL